MVKQKENGTADIAIDINNEEEITQYENESVKEFIFKTKTSPKENINPEVIKNISQKSNADTRLTSYIELKGDPISLICQNINYYMAGIQDIWNKSKKKSGLNFFKMSNPDEPTSDVVS